MEFLDAPDRRRRRVAVRPLPPGTVRRIHGILRRALGQGLKWGWIGVNPAVATTPPVLTSTLRSLERDGFVSRRIYAAVPPRVEYSLKALGLSLVDLAAELRTWAIDHVPDVLEAQAAYDQRTLDSTGDDAP